MNNKCLSFKLHTAVVEAGTWFLWQGVGAEERDADSHVRLHLPPTDR